MYDRRTTAQYEIDNDKKFADRHLTIRDFASNLSVPLDDDDVVCARVCMHACMNVCMYDAVCMRCVYACVYVYTYV